MPSDLCACQVRHQAAGGCRFLCYRCRQRRPVGSRRGHEKAQQREAEANEGAEHPQTGQISQTNFS